MLSVLDDRYELGEPLGSGGTGAVRRAHDRVLGRDVAVKLLHAVAVGDETHRARLREEARLAGMLHTPWAARVYDYGEDPGTTPPTPYVVMELVEGRSLATALAERRTLDVDEVLALLEQVGSALSAAHAAGVVHRDLKPGNIVLAADGRAVLVDFGIARSSGAEPLTATGHVIGTVDYISPEQVAGGSAGPASDVYALGLVAYECLTGHKPFRRESQVATAVAHLREDPPPLPDDVPAGLRHLIARMVAREPSDRPADAAEVAAAVALLRAGAGGAAQPDQGPATTLLTRPPAPGRSGTEPTRRRRLVAAVAAAVLLAAGLLTEAVVGRERSATVPAAGASDTRTPSPAGVRVPRGLVGERYAVAAERLREVGLRPERVARTRRDARPGTVLAVDPGPGDGRVARGAAVRVVVAQSPAHRHPDGPDETADGGAAGQDGAGGGTDGSGGAGRGGAPGKSELSEGKGVGVGGSPGGGNGGGGDGKGKGGR